MSKKTDLLVRVRYENPLPPPPFPPKLLDIPTDVKRFAKPSYAANLVRETPFPMIIDAEMGMPLDLLAFPGLWTGRGTAEINPTAPYPELDPEDEALLLPPEPMPVPGADGTPAVKTTHGHVGWLRKTEYIQKDVSRGQSSLKGYKVVELDRSVEAQLRLIEKTFDDVARGDLSDLKHPTKAGVTAVESYDFLPDPATWPLPYSLFKFAQPPSDADPGTSHIVAASVFHPENQDGEQTLVHYLAETDEVSRQAVEAAKASAPETAEAYPLAFSRVYEVATSKRAVGTEVAFILCDEPSAVEGEEGGGGSRKRPKGAYFHEYDGRMTIKKKRINKDEPLPAPAWDEILLQFTEPTFEVEDERAAGRAMVDDPDWIAQRLAQAEAAEADGRLRGRARGRAWDQKGRFSSWRPRVSDRRVRRWRWSREDGHEGAHHLRAFCTDPHGIVP